MHSGWGKALRRAVFRMAGVLAGAAVVAVISAPPVMASKSVGKDANKGRAAASQSAAKGAKGAKGAAQAAARPAARATADAGARQARKAGSVASARSGSSRAGARLAAERTRPVAKTAAARAAESNAARKSAAATPRGGVRLASANTMRATPVSLRRAAPARAIDPPRPSIGHAIGLHEVVDPLALQSAVALVLDLQSGEVLFEKNAQAVLPIASISKLMTALIVLEAGLPMPEMLEISQADVDTERNTRSRLRTGTRLSRGEMLHLALMSSENRAAHALGRHYPGGLPAFVERMNSKAREIGMRDSYFVEPTGLSSSNVSTARDLALLVRAASEYPLIREYSTAAELTVDTGYSQVSFRNTNRLVDRPDWDIGLQKTGYISEAGNCLVMQTRIGNRPVVLVLLDAQARVARMGDAQRIREWLESGQAAERAPFIGSGKVSLRRDADGGRVEQHS